MICEGCGAHPAEWISFSGHYYCTQCHALMKRLRMYIPGEGR
jgi:hypothetical protein